MGPRVNPAQLPRLREDICVDPLLHSLNVQASRVPVREARRQQRLEKQREVAQTLAMERGRNQIQEMAGACLHSSLVGERTLKRMRERETKRRQDDRDAAQLEIAVRTGVVPTDAPPLLVRQAEKAAKRKRPHLTDAQHQELVALSFSNMSQREIAAKTGVTKSTVGRHLHPRATASERHHGGRQRKLTPEMINTAARFMFLFKQSTWERCTVFLRKIYGVVVSTKTVRLRVKNVCGFRHGDFRRFPRDRNSAAAIEARYKYAMKGGSSEARSLALFEAIYFDEMYLTKNTKTGAWTVVGWTPTVVEETPHETNGVHLSLLMAISPELGVIHWEILEGSVKGTNVLTFFKEMVTRYVTK